MNSGATLRGNGTISSTVSVKDGATLAAGDTLLRGEKLTITKAVTLNAGSTMLVPLYAQDGVYGQSNFALTSLTIKEGAVLELDMSNVQGVEDGKYFTVFAKVPTSRTGEFTVISPAAPADGLVWDTSELYTTGRLYVRSATGIEAHAASSADGKDGKCYDLNGRRVSGSAGGIVIRDGKKIAR